MQQEVQDLINWFISQYITPHVNDNKPITVEINIDEDLDIDGEVEQYEDDYYEIVLRPIEDRDELIRVICHELIHVKQYRLGEMIEKENLVIEFLGVDYDVRTISYNDFPWEIEAWNNEELIHQAWLNSAESKPFYGNN